MITVEEARKCILDTIAPLGCEKVDLLSALGRVNGEEIHARREIPPKDNSAMDGYALISADTLGASTENPAVLEIVEDIAAGRVPRISIHSGQAARIMTGAPVPEGADAVVRMEDTSREGNWVRILTCTPAGRDIRRAGEDVRAGEIVLSPGTRIRAAEIGLLASLGRSFVSVYQRPLVAVLATGDELIDIDGEPQDGKVINSNSYALAAQVIECGAIPLQIGIARDDREDLLSKFMAASRADIIVSSGGVSVGDFDFVKDIMHESGNTMAFWRVAMRPGRPLAFGMIQGKPVFGLPGNPVSSMVSFEQFVRPALLKLMGRNDLFRRTVRAIVQEDIQKETGLRQFIRARLKIQEGRLTAATTGAQGSGILKSMVLADGLIVLPEATPGVKAGEEVTVQVLREP